MPQHANSEQSTLYLFLFGEIIQDLITDQIRQGPFYHFFLPKAPTNIPWKDTEL